MQKLILALLIASIVALDTSAQQDSLFVVAKDGDWFLKHRVKNGETIQSIGAHYNMLPATLASANNLAAYDSLRSRKILYIPLTNQNMLKSPPPENSGYATIYYKTDELDNLQRVSRHAGVTQATLQVWNHMSDNVLKPGTFLKVGWIQTTGKLNSHEAAENIKMAPINSIPPAPALPATTEKDTTKHSLAELTFNYQTSDGQYINQISGSVVFFKSQSTLSDNVFYGFSNEIPKGKVVKVVNPGNGNYAFVKVLGNMPPTKMYHNAKLGVDSRAKELLEIAEDKYWCDLIFGN